jgi:hypothetical protein
LRIRTVPMRDLTVAKFDRMRSLVDLDPPYQREGDVWKPGTRATLIDSIINGLDLPKLYFEDVVDRRLSSSGLRYEYAVIDGKQRLESILAFIDDQLSLADDFYFFEDDEVKASGLLLSQLESTYPHLAERFWSFVLPVIVVHANSGDLVEEMFTRLNAATALNAAEKRNSIQSPTKESVNRLAEHELLTLRSPIRSARYKYRELAVKFLAIEHQLATKKKLVDTKAATLLDLFRATREADRSIEDSVMNSYEESAQQTLERMNRVFTENDPLLRSIGTVVIYYVCFRESDFSEAVSREQLQHFEDARRHAARMSDSIDEYGRPANARLREYNVLVQSTNDGSALSRRAAILHAFVLSGSTVDPLIGLDKMDNESLDIQVADD